jgi:hypothetical protein
MEAFYRAELDGVFLHYSFLEESIRQSLKVTKEIQNGKSIETLHGFGHSISPIRSPASELELEGVSTARRNLRYDWWILGVGKNYLINLSVATEVQSGGQTRISNIVTKLYSNFVQTNMYLLFLRAYDVYRGDGFPNFILNPFGPIFHSFEWPECGWQYLTRDFFQPLQVYSPYLHLNSKRGRILFVDGLEYFLVPPLQRILLAFQGLLQKEQLHSKRIVRFYRSNSDLNCCWDLIEGLVQKVSPSGEIYS